MDVRRGTAEGADAEEAEPPALTTLEGSLGQNIWLGHGAHALATLPCRQRAIAVTPATDRLRWRTARSSGGELRTNNAKSTLAVPLEV
eukprot:6084157-Alexandrium_andersonii.AAC.1